ncbi:hypothetical protein PHAVU_009G005300 [Phaseolus vulgaris]|uniref:Dehydrin n=1 Tax=Phaseolus vulgaris TaxID=3885 RepID=V7AUP3_PHAVU|nr:hypothetical protein PHAVU_009G005300g [Phaseolus vulgaris]ESW07941.1 hypothetical protein PHAVU_009G005300g [Phaseolus vulgaris]
MAEAQLRDQHGNPIPLTDQHGNPVILTDEHGNPVHVTGIATIPPSAATAASGFRTYSGAGSTTFTTTVADLIAAQPRDTRDLHRSSSSSSSSSSSEDDGQGGRRKKGVNKLKEKLPGRKNMEQHSPPKTTATTTATGVPHPTRPTATNPNPNPSHPEHHKKGIMEKIKEKLPGHHNH